MAGCSFGTVSGLKTEENGTLCLLRRLQKGARERRGVGWPATCSSSPVRENGKTLPCLRASLGGNRAVPLFGIGRRPVPLWGDCWDLFLGDPDGPVLRTHRRDFDASNDDRAGGGPAVATTSESSAPHADPGRPHGARNVPDVHSPFVSFRVCSKRKLR